MYAEGHGVEQDFAKSVELYTKAANLGNADAQFELGKAYEDGLGGLPRDNAKALELMLKAEEQGHPFAGSHVSFLQAEIEAEIEDERSRKEAAAERARETAEAMAGKLREAVEANR